ncbi:MAG: extracellular elastinolytic metalloproteinase, partial [Solirubrobacteraceae bacterium]|nr:extracellular elastinolytic metalloproteinase [Solirubrobacteraceae bacterium]
AVFGLDGSDLDALRLDSRYRSPDGVTHLAYTQTYQGVGAYDNVLLANVDGDGRLLNVGGGAIAGLRVASVVPGLDAGAALAAAKRAVGGALVAPRARPGGGPERATRFSNGDRAQLTIFSDGRAGRLAWNVVLTGEHEFLYEAVVDATTGELLKRRSLTEFDNARVYDLYPGAAGAGGTARTVDLAPWLTSTTTLSGNNAHAYADIGPADGPATIVEIAPNPGLPRNWIFPQVAVPTGLSCPPAGCTWDSNIPATREINRSQATAQLFYLVNTYHDHLAASPIGFTNATRGFDVAGGDPVLAETDNLDEGVSPPNTDNSSMSTPPDGQSPKLQVLFFTSPSLNAADAADVVYHEYTHGLTSRSIGTGVGLTADQSRAMGEGWSDWYSLDYLVSQGLMTDTAAPNELEIGRYLQAGGFRMQGADCPVGSACPGTPGTGPGGFTFGDLGRFSAGFSVHDNGEIWLETLWDIRSALGSQTAERLITSGLRLTPNNPSFLEARDGIIQADRVAGGASYTTLWQLFAARGMGYSATTAGADATSATEAFDMPPPLRHESTTVSDPAPGGDGDGIAEPGETVRLVESLRNQSPFGVTGVSGVLRGTTPGVVAVQPSSTWPVFGANAVQTADSPLAVAIPSSLPCGRHAQMSLRVATGQGNATIPLDIPTGRLGPTTSSTDPPLPVPNDPVTGTSTLTFPPSGATVHDLKVRISGLTHTFVGDLRITLEGPGGQMVMLMNSPGAGVGASGDDFVDLILDDDAVTAIENLPDVNPPGGYTGSYRPSERLSTFDGTPLQGTWKLHLTDVFGALDSGTLTGWGLIPAGRQCATPANGEPVGAADAYSVTSGSTLNGSSVLANDSDPDGSPLTAVELSEPAHGTLSLAADGRFTYTPAAGFSGADAFTYVAYDGRATSAPTTVSIAVGAVATPAPASGSSSSGSSAAPPPPPAPPTVSRVPAKLQVQGAGVRGGKLDVLAAITAKAAGKVRVTYRSAGATTAFDAPISGGRIHVRRTLPGSQRSKPTGMVTLAYAGSALVEPDSVTLRAARGKAKLVRTTSRIDAGGRLRVAGTITPRARGLVRVRLGYAAAGGDSTFLDYQAKIVRGRWSLSEQLPAETAAAGGQLSIQFTGYEPLAIRGEQIAKEVAAGR